MAWILLFSSAFTMVASALQIYSDYRKDLSQIDNRMQVIESGYASSLARSLWALDQKLLQTQMEGILSLPDVVHLRLRIEPDSELVMGDIPLMRGPNPTVSAWFTWAMKSSSWASSR